MQPDKNGLAVCPQCGRTLEIDSFQKYYNRDSYYKVCKDCKMLNDAYRRLSTKDAADLTSVQQKQKAIIEETYKLLEKNGLEVFGHWSAQKRMVKELKRVTDMLNERYESVNIPKDIAEAFELDLEDMSYEDLLQLSADLYDKYMPTVRDSKGRVVLKNGLPVRNSDALTMYGGAFKRLMNKIEKVMLKKEQVLY